MQAETLEILLKFAYPLRKSRCQQSRTCDKVNWALLCVFPSAGKLIGLAILERYSAHRCYWCRAKANLNRGLFGFESAVI